MRARLRQQMFATTKADFEPDFAGDEGEKSSGVGDRPGRDFKLRQAVFDQPGVVGPQRLAAAAPIERAPRAFVVAVQETRPRNWLARSVFSQEKPPSASGLRPKWP
jgi:hypothetical protein